jgi:hypothetical protein
MPIPLADVTTNSAWGVPIRQPEPRPVSGFLHSRAHLVGTVEPRGPGPTDRKGPPPVAAPCPGSCTTAPPPPQPVTCRTASSPSNRPSVTFSVGGQR